MRIPDNGRTRVCVYALIIAPLILSLVVIKLFGVNLVYADEWEIVPLVEKLYTGSLTAGDLLSAHNEHRILFPRLIMLSMAHLTRFNTPAVMFFSWALAAIAFLLIFVMYRRDFDRSTSALLLFAPIPWLIFSLRQYESFLWGFEIQMYLCATGFVGAIFLLEKANKYAFAGAVCSGIVSTFSTANGLLVWPLGIVLILLLKMQKKAVFISLWALIGIVVWIAYLCSGGAMAGNRDIFFVLKEPLTSLVFLIINIGSPFAFVKSSAFGMGMVVSIFMIAALILAVREGAGDNARWITLILFSLGSSLVLTVGRAESGFWAAMASRYVPLIIFGVVGAYVIIVKTWRKAEDEDLRQKYAMLYGALLSVVLVGLVSGYTSGVARGKEIHDIRSRVADHLAEYDRATDKDLEPILFDVAKVRKRVKILEKYRLSVFQDKSHPTQ